MKKQIISILTIVIILFSISSIANANSINKNSNELNQIQKNNQQIYLGYSSILGNGSSSTLAAELENDIIIRLDSTSDFVDFYIDYEMNCYGLTDEGIITLTIFLNDENVSFNLVQTGLLTDSKNGSLTVGDVSVESGDALTFRINVVYGSVIPLYSNTTTATGFGVVSKQKTVSNNMFVFGSSVDVKIVQLEPDEDYVDLEVLDKTFYIFNNGLFQEPIKISAGAFIRLYTAKGLFSPSLPICLGFCSDYGIIG
jgi:hypothetical protein